jgi:hypothetical protein
VVDYKITLINIIFQKFWIIYRLKQRQAKYAILEK